MRKSTAACGIAFIALVGCRSKVPTHGPDETLKSKKLSQGRPEITAAVAFVARRGATNLDLESARIINDADSYCDVAFTNPVAISAGKHPQGEVFRVEKTSLEVRSYGAD